MERARKIIGFMLLSNLGLCLFGGTSWAFSKSLLASSEQTDAAWLVADATQPESAQSILEQKSHRSSGVAISLALVPGVVLHGAGHFYANRPWTAGVLLLAEAGGLVMAYRGGRDVYSAVDSVDFNNFSNYHGDTGQLSNGMGLALGGVMIFLSSWLFDLTGSPLAADQNNTLTKPRTGNSASPVITPRLTMRGLEVAIERLF